MDRRLFLGASSSLLLAGAGYAQVKDPPKGAPASAWTVELESREDGLVRAPEMFKRIGKSPMAPGARIIAPFFNLEVVDEVDGSATSRKRGGGSASSNFKVNGIDDVFTQGLVDRIYASMMEDMKAAGYQIVSREEALADGNYAKLVASEKPAGFRANTDGGGKSKFFAPSGRGSYFHYGDERFGTLSSQFGSMGNASAETMIPAALNASVMGIEMAVRFVSVSTSGGGKYSNLFGSGDVNVRGYTGFGFIPSRTRIWFWPNPIPRDGRQVLLLNRAIKPKTDPILSVDDVTTKGQVAGDVAAKAVGALFALGGVGSGISSSTKSYAINLDTERFPNVFDGCVSGVAAAMVKQLGMPAATR